MSNNIPNEIIESLKIINGIKENPIVKKYNGAVKKMVNCEWFGNPKGEKLLYREVDGLRYWVILPYKEIVLLKGEYQIVERGYDYQYERSKQGERVQVISGCRAYCNETMETIINVLNEAIKKANENE